VGGHYSAGEGIEGGVREISEELGLSATPADLVQVGWRREEFFYPNGLIEREVQDICFLLRNVDLAALRSEPSEVSAVALVSASLLARLAAGRVPHCRVPGGLVQNDGRVSPIEVTVSGADLVPRAGDYYGRAARFARRLATGHALVRRRRWW
jgi:hypothetical protein